MLPETNRLSSGMIRASSKFNSHFMRMYRDLSGTPLHRERLLNLAAHSAPSPADEATAPMNCLEAEAQEEGIPTDETGGEGPQ